MPRGRMDHLKIATEQVLEGAHDKAGVLEYAQQRQVGDDGQENGAFALLLRLTFSHK